MQTSTTAYIGTLTAVGPIHQGGTNEGNVSPVKRETIMMPDGTQRSVQTVSGNGIRGALRRISAELTLQHVDQDALNPAVLSAVISGGQLSNKQTEWTPEQRVALSRAVPHIATFGVAGGLGMTPGQWQCGSAYPVCADTAHITGIESDVSARSLSEIIEGTRMDSGGYHPNAPAETLGSVTAQRDTDQMIFSTEAIPAGTEFWWHIAVSTAFNADRWLALVIREWQRTGGHVGGMSARGYGATRLAGGIAEWADATPAPDRLDPAAVTDALRIIT